MATDTEINAMAQNVVTDAATLALLVDLRKMGGAGESGADLIEWFIDNRAESASALREAREVAESYRKQADDSAAVLCRIGVHLASLAAFCEDRPENDPFPESRA